MSDFALSPGITPELTDASILVFVLALGIGYAWKGALGVEVAVALSAIGLGVIKLVTDYTDLLDIPVGLVGVVGGGAVLWGAIRPRTFLTEHRTIEIVLGVLILLIGGYKIARDFYDPFDLLLAVLSVILGLWLTLGRYGTRRSGGPTPAVGPVGPSGG